MTRPTPDEARTQIVEVLGDSVNQALGLRDSLQEERDALENQDSDALIHAVSRKSACVERLQELEQRRSSLCVAAGFDAGPEQMERMSRWCDEDAVVNGCWEHLMEIATDCNSLNLTNGAIIRLRRQHIDTNLLALRGDNLNPNTYRSSGDKPGSLPGRSLARA